MLQHEVRVERASRLRRYLRKDYSQRVDFPVEIVGRDGAVRRYSFDDSLRLYQRRIQTASIRYDDGELVDAEVRHCRQRIEQLRRSYLDQYGWGALRGDEPGGGVRSALAADMAAFLRAAFAWEPGGATGLRIDPVRSGPGEVFYLRCARSGRAWFLYAWDLGPDGPADARADAERTLRQLADAPQAPGVERLCYAVQGGEAWFALAGEHAWTGPEAPHPERDEALRDRLQEGLRALYDGRVGEALVRFESDLGGPRPRLLAAQGAALAALLVEDPERADFDARQGRLNWPGDPLLAYLFTLSAFRLGLDGEAAERLGSAVELAPSHSGALLLQALAALGRGRPDRAWAPLTAACRSSRGASYVSDVARVTRTRLRRAALATGLAGLVAAVGAALLVAGSVPVSAGLLVGLGAIGVPLPLVVRAAHARAALRGVRRPGVPRLVSLDLLPTPGDRGN